MPQFLQSLNDKSFSEILSIYFNKYHNNKITKNLNMATNYLNRNIQSFLAQKKEAERKKKQNPYIVFSNRRSYSTLSRGARGAVFD